MKKGDRVRVLVDCKQKYRVRIKNFKDLLGTVTNSNGQWCDVQLDEADARYFTNGPIFFAPGEVEVIK